LNLNLLTRAEEERILPNVQDEPRPWLARLVLLGARDVTAMVVGSGALLGRFANVLQLLFSHSQKRESKRRELSECYGGGEATYF
jgi:hypothetical protein